MKNVNFSEIKKVLNHKKRILVASHLRPDADAYGSTIASALWLRSEGHEVMAWNADGMLEKFSFLPSSEILTYPEGIPRAFDIILTLDTSIKNRLGTVINAIEGDPLWICIDHHKSNEGYASMNIIDSSKPATGEILTEIFLSEGIPITQDMAINLFAAISGDTGSFQYEGTTARTYEIASQLIRMGVNVPALSRSLYENQPKRRLELLRHALVNAQFSCDNKIASFSLSLKVVMQLGILSEDTEGILDNFRSVQGVKAVAFFEELRESKVRVSLRSKDPRLDVSLICEKFGGGGHAMASGARISGSLQEIEKNILQELDEAIKRI